MQTITEIQVRRHGIHFPDYFQGCGTSFTKFNNVVTGIGDTEKEAFDDCIEQIAQSNVNIDLFDFDSYLETIDQNKHISNDYNEDSETPFFHVSILYNVKEN